LGVQTDPGLVGGVAGQPKNAPPAFRAGQVTRALVQGRPEVRSVVAEHELEGRRCEANRDLSHDRMAIGLSRMPTD